MYYNMGVNKKPFESKSEDLVGSNNSFFWLLDGATPPIENKNKELTQIYLNLLNAALSNHSLECKSTGILLETSIATVRDIFLKNYNVNSSDYLPYSTAVIFKVDREIEYSILGDSYLSIVTDKTSVTITDDRLKQFAVEERKIVQEMRKSGIDEKSVEYIEARKKLIRAELNFQNVDGGYWIASLNPLAAKESISGTLSLDNCETFFVFAASDGLARIVTHFGAFHDLNSLGNEITRVGAICIFNMLRSLESDMANFLKPVSSKNDDASFIIVSSN